LLETHQRCAGMRLKVGAKAYKRALAGVAGGGRGRPKTADFVTFVNFRQKTKNAFGVTFVTFARPSYLR